MAVTHSVGILLITNAQVETAARIADLCSMTFGRPFTDHPLAPASLSGNRFPPTPVYSQNGKFGLRTRAGGVLSPGWSVDHGFTLLQPDPLAGSWIVVPQCRRAPA